MKNKFIPIIIVAIISIIAGVCTYLFMNKGIEIPVNEEGV